MKCSRVPSCRSCPSCLPDVTVQRQEQPCSPDLQRSSLSGPFADHVHSRFRARLSALTSTATAKQLALNPKLQEPCPLVSIQMSALLLSCMERYKRSLPVMKRPPIAPQYNFRNCIPPFPIWHANKGCNRKSTLLGLATFTCIGQSRIGDPVRAVRGHAGRFRLF